MTGDIVSYTGLVTNTDGDGDANLATGKIRIDPDCLGTLWTGAGTTRFNCDSCHQVHNAEASSGSWILEGHNDTATGPKANYGGITDATPDIPETSIANSLGSETMVITGLGVGLNDFSNFCAMCHPK